MGQIFHAKWALSSEKKMHFIWVSMYLAGKSNWGHFFYVSLWRRNRHFKWTSEPHEGLPVCRAKKVPSFLRYFNTLSIAPAPGCRIHDPSLCSQALYDWANPAAVKMVLWNIKTFYFFLFLVLFFIMLWEYYVVIFRSKLKCFHLLAQFFTFHLL